MLKQLGILIVVSAVLSACGAEQNRTSLANVRPEIAWDEISSPKNITQVYSSNLIQSGPK